MFALRVGTNPKCVAHLPSLLEVVLVGKNTVNNPFVGLGHAVGVSLTMVLIDSASSHYGCGCGNISLAALYIYI